MRGTGTYVITRILGRRRIFAVVTWFSESATHRHEISLCYTLLLSREFNCLCAFLESSSVCIGIRKFYNKVIPRDKNLSSASLASKIARNQERGLHSKATSGNKVLILE